MPVKVTAKIPQSLLHEKLSYESGVLYWRKTGKIAGCYKRKDRYGCIRINSTLILLHRAVWVYHNGDIPDGLFIDHIDGNRQNNLIENLRLASTSQNLYNRGPRRDSLSGIKNVRWNEPTQSWRVKMFIDGKWKHFGLFGTIEEADAVARHARERNHGAFANHNSIGGNHSR
jgi:hypothetical protein